ncbi:MAG TPA: hypothetical protein EYH27_06165 [Anaerolineales bacterium]|nr:hypothetical protein [Anaerolineales bacterium]
MRRVLPLVLTGLAVGIALGLLVGWVLWPVRYTNTTPAQLRQDYRTEYVLMVAAAYEVEGDLEAARARLTLLDPEQPGRPVRELAETLIAEGGQETDIRMLVRLAAAMGVTTPAMAPYLEEAP